MTKIQVLLALLAPLLPVSLAQYPAIEAQQGFQVDMEPFWIETDLDETNPTPLDVQGYFRQEMQTVMPNIMGVILQKYDDTEFESTTASRAFYTGMAVFQGPPYRTNHNVYQGQTATLSSIRAVKEYLRVHDAQLGIPEWFDTTTLGVDKVEIREETDSIIDPNLLFGGSNHGISPEGLAVGVAIGFILGAVFTFMVMVCRKHQSKRGPVSPMTPRRSATRHKRKQSDDDFDLDLAIQEHPTEEESNSSNSDNGDESPEEVFSDEEAQAPLTNSPSIKDLDAGELTPRKRRPSHHRRWKSTAFNDMKSPSSVMDGLFLPSTPKSASKSKSHRRSNSLADSNHRRSNSLADAFNKLSSISRRDSMQDLLASVDMAELMNDNDSAEHNFD